MHNLQKELIKFVAFFILFTFALYYLVEVPFYKAVIIALLTGLGTAIFNLIYMKVNKKQ